MLNVILFFLIFALGMGALREVSLILLRWFYRGKFSPKTERETVSNSQQQTPELPEGIGAVILDLNGEVWVRVRRDKSYSYEWMSSGAVGVGEYSHVLRHSVAQVLRKGMDEG